ncbi:MAG: transglutaminase-like domain-containing protein [Azovibrio sp.]
MKRRAFLAASLLTLCNVPALAANKKTVAKKSALKKTPSTRKKTTAPSRSQTTAENSVLESAHQGSSATRLPPVKAPEPPALWRKFQISTTVTLTPSRGRQHLWLPLPMNQDTLYQRTLGHTWQGNFELGSLRRLPDGDLETFYCEWPENITPQLTLSTIVTTADRVFEVSRRTQAPEREDILRRNLQATQLLPNEGQIYTLAQRIIGRILDPIAQARTIHDWVVENTEYDLTQPSPGTGDVRKQVEQHLFKGRSADINGLFVALCRSIGIPARRVYGLRIAPSRITSSLGITDDDATHASHCRAEFYVPGYSWIPVDPSDARRAAAVEKLEHSRLLPIKKLLFGVWEMNWMAYNLAEDLVLPGEAGAALPFFTLPRLERQEGILDGQDPKNFTYHIQARKILD